jgi:hypothetical protein
MEELQIEIAETKAKIKLAEDAGGAQEYLTKLTGILEQLYTKENRLAVTTTARKSISAYLDITYYFSI